MAHAGDEFRLALARFRELAARVLDFLEQPHVLDCDYRLIGKGGDQLDLLVGEWPHDRTRQHERTNRISLAQQRNGEHGAKARSLLRLDPSVFRIGQNIGDLDNPAFSAGPAPPPSPVLP